MNWIRGHLVRGEGWCVALTSEEQRDLVAQAQKLSAQVADSWLMEGETISLEAQTEVLSLVLTGTLTHFTLILTLYYGRRFEGEWASSIADQVLRELAHSGNKISVTL